MKAEPFEQKFFHSAVNMDLKLYHCGSENCAPNDSWGPGLKDHYKIHYVHAGKGTLYLKGKSYSLVAGQGFLIVPGTVASYKADAQDPWSYSWVGFNGLHAELYLKYANLSVDHPVFHCGPGQDVRIRQLFHSMSETIGSKGSRDIKLLGLLYTILAAVIEVSNAESGYQKAETVKHQYVKMAINFIEANYSHAVSIERLAGELKLNRKYLSKIFKEATSISPQEYLIRLRMNTACELMKHTSLGIREISNSVGYNDQLLFSRMFKKNLGASPSFYRKRL